MISVIILTKNEENDLPRCLDGLRLDWNDRWLHVRSSNTEPIVRVIAEATEGDQARALAEEVGRVVRSSRDAGR